MWAIFMIVLILFTLPNERPEQIDTIGFSTTESAELYFKNVRSFYYRNNTEAEGILDVYRLESIFVDSLPSLPFAMYNNWRTNETFIRLDTAFINTREVVAVIADSAGLKTDTIRFPEMSNESQYLFARDIYRALEEREKLGLATESEVIWLQESTNRSVKRTLTDYFRLLGKL
ncbi:MAG TPA: hypothetical protein VJ949_04690 [Cryomorphaceae bacterium]|nr:hypothetical protein [Cryomorphaceae bacterium]